MQKPSVESKTCQIRPFYYYFGFYNNIDTKLWLRTHFPYPCSSHHPQPNSPLHTARFLFQNNLTTSVV